MGTIDENIVPTIVEKILSNAVRAFIESAHDPMMELVPQSTDGLERQLHEGDVTSPRKVSEQGTAGLKDVGIYRDSTDTADLQNANSAS